MKKIKVLLRIIGIGAIVIAILGIFYSISTLFTDFLEPSEDKSIFYFSAFYVMSIICLGINITLLVCGIQFVRLRSKLLKLFISTIKFEVIYFVLYSWTWLIPKINISMATAGVVNGSLGFQIITLFPIWAYILARLAIKEIEKSGFEELTL